ALPALSSKDEAARAYLAGRAAFQAGGVLRLDPNRFWTSQQFRADIVTGVKGLFRPDSGPMGIGRVDPQYLPLHQRPGNEFHFLSPIRLPIGDQGMGIPRYMVEGFIRVAAAAPDTDSVPRRGWYVAGIDLERGLSVPFPGPGGPGR